MKSTILLVLFALLTLTSVSAQMKLAGGTAAERAKVVNWLDRFSGTGMTVSQNAAGHLSYSFTAPIGTLSQFGVILAGILDSFDPTNNQPPAVIPSLTLMLTISPIPQAGVVLFDQWALGGNVNTPNGGVHGISVPSMSMIETVEKPDAEGGLPGILIHAIVEAFEGLNKDYFQAHELAEDAQKQVMNDGVPPSQQVVDIRTESPLDTLGVSVQCRIYHLGAPKAGAPAIHCPQSPQSGGGICGPVNASPTLQEIVGEEIRVAVPAVGGGLEYIERLNSAPPVIHASNSCPPGDPLFEVWDLKQSALGQLLIALPQLGQILGQDRSENVIHTYTALGLAVPGALCTDDKRGILWAADALDGSLHGFDMFDGSELIAIPGAPGSLPMGMAVGAEDGFLYTVDPFFNRIDVIDTTNGTVVQTINELGIVTPTDIAAAADGSFWVAVHQSFGTGSVIQLKPDPTLGTGYFVVPDLMTLPINYDPVKIELNEPARRPISPGFAGVELPTELVVLDAGNNTIVTFDIATGTPILTESVPAFSNFLTPWAFTAKRSFLLAPEVVPFPGSGEDLILESAANNATPTHGSLFDEKVALGGDNLQLQFSSPSGTFDAAPALLFAQILVAGQTPFGIPSLPAIQFDFDQSILVAGSMAPLGPNLGFYPGATIDLNFTVPFGLVNFSVFFQGIAVAPQAANGIFAATDAQEIRVISSF